MSNGRRAAEEPSTAPKSGAGQRTRAQDRGNIDPHAADAAQTLVGRLSPARAGALQQLAGNQATKFIIQRQLLESTGEEFVVRGPYSAGSIELLGGEHVVETPGSRPPFRTVRLLEPHRDAGATLGIPSMMLRPTSVTPSGRSTHEWRTALQNARNDLVGSMVDAKQEFYQRHESALSQFASTMSFAQSASAAGLILKAEFNELVGVLPEPVSTIVKQVTIVADAYRQSSAAQEAVDLATWIERKRDALQAMRERDLDPTRWPEIQPINRRIEQLVSDSSSAAEAERQDWETSMLNATFPVEPSAPEIEFSLYDEWCYKKGAYFVVHMYQTDRNYPGDEDVGRTDMSHAAFRGEQRWARNVPTQILDRLQRLGLLPQNVLEIPTETVHHRRTAPARGGLPAQYEESGRSRYSPYRGARADEWTGPEEFHRRGR